MEDRDFSGVIVAAVAALLTAAAWLLDALVPAHPRPRDTMEAVSARILETQPAGEPATWRDPKTGMVATIIAADAYRDRSGRWCRPYTLAVSRHDGWHKIVSRRLACRDLAGDWATARPAPVADGEQPATAGIGEQIARFAP